MNKKNNEVMLSLSSVSLNIPILNNQRRTIKNLISNTVGSIIKRETSKKSSVAALNSINCEFKEGERVGLLGHNGSGKTSLLKVIS